MSTLPMIAHPSPQSMEAALASRGVFSPGGYEWWRIEARSGAGVTVEVDLRLGDIGRAWWRRWRRYLRRPTHQPPPMPADLPLLRWRVRQGREIRVAGEHRAMHQEFGGVRDPFSVTIGPGRLEQASDGSMQIVMASPHRPAMRLLLRPRWKAQPAEPPLMTETDGGAHHWRVEPGVAYDVSGDVPGGHNDADKVFDGVGTCSYFYGTRPLAEDVIWWLSARLPLPGRLLWVDWRFDPQSRGQYTVTESSPEGIREIVQDPGEIAWSMAAHRPQWPLELPLGNGMRLIRPQVLTSSIGHARLQFDVKGASAPAADCGIIRPRWFGW